MELLGRLKHRNLKKGDGYEFPVTQEQIAHCLGLTPIHVNRILGDLRARGIVEIRDKTLRVYDERELTAMAELQAHQH